MEKEFSKSEAKRIGIQIGIDFNVIDLEQFRKGLAIELEHGTELGDDTNVTNDDISTTGKIAWAHLKEIPDYYTRLEKLEGENEAQEQAS